MPTPPDLAQWLVRSLARLSATFCIVQGITIVSTGRQRWSGDAFRAALQVPGAPPSWGWFLTLAGVLALVGSLRRRPRLVRVGLYAGAVWSFFFAAGFIRSSLNSSTASTTGIWAYLFFSAVFVILAEGHRRR